VSGRRANPGYARHTARTSGLHGRIRGKGIRVVVVDTGLYRKAAELPWMRAVTGDPDLGEAVSTRAVSAAARVQAPTIYQDLRRQAGACSTQ
jgi:hypothetical protein